MRAALVLIAILLLVSFIDQAFGAADPRSHRHGLDPARVWFARRDMQIPGHVIQVRPDCGAAVVEKEDQSPWQSTHCARI